MFTLSATPVMFCALLALFTLSLVGEVRALARARTTTARVSSGLHLLMAVLMILMVPTAWWHPFERVVPIPVQVAVMALATLWFVVATLRAHPGHRLHPAICATMFATMVWHLSAMELRMRHMMAATGGSSDHTMGGAGHDMASTGHDMSQMPAGHSMGQLGATGQAHGSAPMTDWVTTASQPGHVMWWLAVIGVVLCLALVVAAARDVVAIARTRTLVLERSAEAAMCLGMAWMSVGLLTPVLPWAGTLRF